MNSQPLAEAIVTLRGTILPNEEHSHFYVAEAPVTAGLNPLLLVIEDSNGTREFRNVLAVLPAWRIHSDQCGSDLYQAALGRVRAKYKTVITDLRKANLEATLPKSIVDGRHCGNGVPTWLAKPLDLLIDDAIQCNASPRLISEVNDLLSLSPHDDTDIVPWNVLHLCSDEPNAADAPDWYILKKWDDWLARGLSSAQCFAEYRQHHKRPDNQNAFNGMFYHLGLPVPLKPGVKRRRENNWRLKKALRENLGPP